MITILFAALCVAYDNSGACIDRDVWPAGMWEGPDAVVLCEVEAYASRQRLEQAGIERHFTIYCESQSAGE